MKSIETAQATAKKQAAPLKSSIESSAKPQISEGSFEELGISRKQFHFFFNGLPVGIALNKIVYDKTGTPVAFIVLDVNAAYECSFGIKKEQILNQKMASIYPEIKRGPIDWIGTYGRVASTGKPERFEVRYPANQNYYYVTVHSPKKGYCLSAFMNITEHKKAAQNKLDERQKIETELNESLEKYQYLLRHAPTAICEIDISEMKFKTVNDTMCQMLGYTEQELLNLSPFDLLYPESQQSFQEGIAKGIDGKEVADSIEYHCKTKDGRGIWCVLHSKLKYKNGKPDTVLAVINDITARKKAEQALVLAEKRYRRLYETTQDGIMARDLEGKMIDCNQAYAKMLGYTKKELRSLSVKQLLPEKWQEQREKIANKVIQTGRSIVFEREYRRKDGTIFPASVRTWRLTDGKGKVIGIWSIVREISQQKKLQKSLEKQTGLLEKILEDRTKRLKDAERLIAIGQTAGMVGHDLRNPLQTVIGELYLAKSEVDSIASGEAKSNLQESIRVIEEQAIYMDKIVSDLQAFVQPVKIDKKPLDLKNLINSVLTTIPIPENVSMQTNLQESFPEIKADPHLLKRVLINLVTNAVQAMPNGGNLNLTAQVNSQAQVIVTVNDTGVGIPDEIKRQIFTPLFTTKPRGQGFGLAVCKRVIEAHGGTISFESTEGKGAKFTIQFSAN